MNASNTQHEDELPRSEESIPMTNDEASAAEDSESESTPASLEEQLEAAVNERDANYDRWMRAQAELENYRRRVKKEAEETRLYQSLPFVRELLPGLDNLQRAIDAGESSKNIEQLLEGVQLVAKQFQDVLSAHSVELIEAVGKSFDPNLHEAIQQIPSEEQPAMTVLEEFQPGYKIHERVIRPSKVIVSSGPPVPPEPTE